MTTANAPKPNLYLSPGGVSVEILGRTGLRYSECDRQMFVDSEVLVPPAGIVIYRDSIVRWEPPRSGGVIDDVERDRIVRRIVEILGARGVEVQVI